MTVIIPVPGLDLPKPDEDGWVTYVTSWPRWGPWRGRRVRLQHRDGETRNLVDDPHRRP